MPLTVLHPITTHAACLPAHMIQLQEHTMLPYSRPADHPQQGGHSWALTEHVPNQTGGLLKSQYLMSGLDLDQHKYRARPWDRSWLQQGQWRVQAD